MHGSLLVRLSLFICFSKHIFPFADKDVGGYLIECASSVAKLREIVHTDPSIYDGFKPEFKKVSALLNGLIHRLSVDRGVLVPGQSDTHRPLRSHSKEKRASRRDPLLATASAPQKPISGPKASRVAAKRASSAEYPVAAEVAGTSRAASPKRDNASTHVTDKEGYDERGYVVLRNFCPEHASIPLVLNDETVVTASGEKVGELVHVSTSQAERYVKDNLQRFGIMQRDHVPQLHSSGTTCQQRGRHRIVILMCVLSTAR